MQYQARIRINDLTAAAIASKLQYEQTRKRQEKPVHQINTVKLNITEPKNYVIHLVQFIRQQKKANF